jgi:hypothetical protein
VAHPERDLCAVSGEMQKRTIHLKELTNKLNTLCLFFCLDAKETKNQGQINGSAHLSAQRFTKSLLQLEQPVKCSITEKFFYETLVFKQLGRQQNK